MSCVTSHVFGQSGEAYRWRVCYQRGLPCLVFLFAMQIIALHYTALHCPASYDDQFTKQPCSATFTKPGREQSRITQITEVLKSSRLYGGHVTQITWWVKKRADGLDECL